MRLLSPILTVVIILALSSSLTGNAAEPKQESLTAQQILQRMGRVYANCKSYSDSGVVSTVFTSAKGKRTVKKPFTTAFIRPDRFRFEYTERKSDNRTYHYIVWRKGKAVRTWWDVHDPAVELPQSLDLALAGATGVSGGSAHSIPAMLLPMEVSGSRLTNLRETHRLPNAKLSGVECFRIEGRKSLSGPIVLWIDTRTLLLRRIYEQTDFGDFRAVETTTYEPVVNGKVTDKMLEFRHPE